MDIQKDKNSRWYEVKFVPDKYILAKEDRTQNIDGQVFDSLPVIDLAKHKQAVEAILMASQEFGFFKVINHGVSKKTIVDAMNVLKDFHEMPSKEAIGGGGSGWAHQDNSMKDGVYLWRESLKHPCHPLEECIHLWPKKPTKYSEVMQAYLLQIQKLSDSILEMIAEGLGLEPGYIKNMSEVKLFVSNFYPPCPDPSLTIGLPAHRDPSLITILYQSDSTTGLQILKDGQWVNVGTTDNFFVVNIGNQLEIISNGKLKSVDHRIVNSTEARISIAIHVNPSTNSVIEPAKVLVNESEPARYKASLYGDYVQSNNPFGDYTAALYNTTISERFVVVTTIDGGVAGLLTEESGIFN